MKSLIAILVLGLFSYVNGQSELCFGLEKGTKLNIKNLNKNYKMCDDYMTSEIICDSAHDLSAILEQCLSDAQMTSLSTTISETTTNEPDDSICAGLDDGTLIDNPANCDEFFMCFLEIPILGVCPEPQYFNPETSSCDDPDNVFCDDGSTTTQMPNLCEGESDGYRFANPRSCSHFFICLNNIAMPAECPLGLYFNIDTGGCHPPHTVECTTPTTTTTEEPATTTEEPFNDACVDVLDGTLVNNPASCDAFYFCLNGNAISGICPPSTVFNPVIGICDSIDNFNCPDYETTTELFNVCYDQDDFTFLDDSRLCEAYFLCLNREPISLTCPDGMYFDPSTLICSAEFVCGDNGETTTMTTTDYATTEETTTTTNVIPDSCPSSGDTLAIPDPLRCSRFILCTSGLEFPMACQREHHFNFDEQRCLHRNITKCSIPLPVCDPEESSSAPIAIVHPRYCERFFFCFIGQMQEFECGQEQHFDLLTEKCSPWEEVGCEL